MRLIFTLLALFMLVPYGSGQEDTLKHNNDSLSGRFYLLQKVKRGGETLPEIEIKEVTVYGRKTSAMRSVIRKYDRLAYNLRRVYPYALIVRVKLDEINRQLEAISSDKERKRFLKEVEKDVFGDYEDDIRDMTITQGRLLIKLIDRETQNTSYTLIRQYRGGLSAAFWQGIARIFGTNLKEEYDPYGEDALIEMIVIEIEAGLL